MHEYRYVEKQAFPSRFLKSIGRLWYDFLTERIGREVVENSIPESDQSNSKKYSK